MMDDVQVAMEVLAGHFGPPVQIWQELHRWSWRQVPFGPCPRCRWPAHTLAPNGSPFHPFCWGNPVPVSSFERWLQRKVAEEEAGR
jgi:hypothetical protein